MPPTVRRAAAVVLAAALLLAVAPARGEPGRPEQTVYVDLLGKGGLYGLGYELRLHGRLSAGAAVSWLAVDRQDAITLSPYLSWLPAARRRHAWFVHAGPHIVRIATRSPVPEWDGPTRTGLGAQLSTGYEHRRGRLLVRGYAMAAVGAGGVAPWIGASLGWRL